MPPPAWLSPTRSALLDDDEDVDRVLSLLTSGRPSVVLPRALPDGERARLHTAYPFLDDAAARANDAWDIATVTSGSTGTPKLVATSWQRVERGLEAIHARQALDDVDVTGVCLPPHYSFALVNQLLWALWAGRRVAPLPGFGRPLDVLAAMRARQVQMVCLVGQQARILARLGIVDEHDPLPGVRRVCFAGGPFPWDLLPRLRRLFPGARFFNNYGCTEAFPRVSIIDVDDAAGPDDVGLPIGDLSVTVDEPDEHGVGWLVVRGSSTALGALDGAGRVVPFAADGSFRTGDKGAVDARGHLRIAGRADQIVKIAGERISLVAVEAVLRGFPGVHDAVALGIAGTSGELELGAVLVGVDDVDAKALRAYLQPQLPRAAWPTVVRAVREPPLLPSGKIDRQALAAMLRA